MTERNQNQRAKKAGMRRGRRRHPKKRGGTLKLLGALCIVALLGAAASFSASTNLSTLDIVKLFQNQQPETAFSWDDLPGAKNLNFAGVKLGMSPSEVERLHPKISVAQQLNGLTSMRYFQNDATFTIWFANHRGESKAYRMRFDKQFKDKTEAEVMDKIGKAYGRPNTTKCSRKQVPAIRTCTFKFLGKDGIAVTFHLRVIKPSPSSNNAESRIELAMDVLDTLLEGKRLREKSALRLARGKPS